MIPAAIYARVSSEMQAAAETPIAGQLQELRRYALANGYEIVREYVDEGISGTTDQREAFRAMRADADQKQPPFQAILVWKFDRIARNVMTAATFREMLKRRGVKLISLTEPSIDGPHSIIINSVLDAMAELYSLQLAENTLRGQKVNARMGLSSGGRPPYGLMPMKIDLESGVQKTQWKVDPATAPTVRRIYEMYVDGMGYKKIAQTLTEEGVPSPRGGPWNANSLVYILHHNQPAYTGRLIFNREDNKNPGKKYKDKKEWIVREAAWEPIVPEELAEAARLRRKNVHMPLRTAGNNIFMLSGMVYCSCGAPMVGSTSSGRKQAYTYYRCTAQTMKGQSVCDAPQIRKDELEELILKDIRDNFFDLESMRKMEAEALASLIDSRERVDTDKKTTLADLRDLRSRRDNIYKAIESSGGLSTPGLLQRLNGIEKEIAAREAHLKELETQAKTEPRRSTDDELLNFAGILKESLTDSDGAAGLIKQIVHRVDVSAETVDVIYVWNAPGHLTRGAYGAGGL